MKAENEGRATSFRGLTIGLLLMAVGGLVLPQLIDPCSRQDYSSNYRLPYRQGEDYYLFKQYLGSVAETDAIPILGDSVVWGHYASEDEALSAQLNDVLESRAFVNLGIDGIHPAAMFGLLRFYGDGLREKTVVLSFNYLWMSSPQHDLSGG